MDQFFQNTADAHLSAGHVCNRLSAFGAGLSGRGPDCQIALLGSPGTASTLQTYYGGHSKNVALYGNIREPTILVTKT